MKKPETTKIPQPPELPIVGNAHLLDKTKPIQSLMQIAKTQGDIYRMNLAGHPLVVISSQKIVSELSDESRFEKALPAALKHLRPLTGDALFTAETKDVNWEKAHRILMPVFGPLAVQSMFDNMLDVANQMFTKWERMGDETVVDVPDNMTRLTLDTIALASFNFRFNSFYQNEMHPFIDAMVDSLAEASLRARRPDFVTKVLLSRNNQFTENVRLMHETGDQLIAQRRRTPSGSSKKDLLDVMLSVKDSETGEGLTDENIRNQMVTFLIAGHETTSGLLSFAVYELLKNPKVLKRARAEVDQVFAGREPRVSDLPRLGYIDQILKETLRLWPTAPAFAVRSLQPQTIVAGKFEVTSEDVLLILAPSLHRDPVVWADAEVFDPDRMAPESFDKLPPGAWKPFGSGVRGCIGRSFAMQEAILVLSMAIHRFNFDFEHPGYELQIKETLTLKPDNFKIRIAKRRFIERDGPTLVSKVTQHLPKESSPGLISVQQNLIPFLVLFGSNSGSSEAFARTLSAEASTRGFAPQLASMDEYTGKLPKNGVVILVTASYEGQPPDNAKTFVDWLRDVEPESLKGVSFGVFGCGNRDWARTYQAVPIFVDEALEKAGAERVVERGEADARADFFGTFESWSTDLWPALERRFALTPLVNGVEKLSVEVKFVEPAKDLVVRAQGLQFGKVMEIRELVDTSAPGSRSKVHVKLSLPNGISYQAGDYLSVLGANPPENVKRVLERFMIEGEAEIVVLGKGLQNLIPVDRPISVVEVLTHFAELSYPATKNQILQLADNTSCPPEKQALRDRIENDESYESTILRKRVSVLDLLERYQSCRLAFGAFLQMLPPLKPRQYSISSSPLNDPNSCTLTVAVVKSQAFAGNGTFLGVTSNFLANLKPGDRIPLMPKASQAGFHLPEDPEVPIIAACAGTGIAPFRGFLEERAILKRSGAAVGKALLFFGCDHPDVDFLYREELEEFARLGVVEVKPAFSTSPEGGIQFVQHRVWADRVEVRDFLAKGARVYVCGDGQSMAPAVRKVFGDSFQESTNATSLETENWFKEMELNMRYVEDVFS